MTSSMRDEDQRTSRGNLPPGPYLMDAVKVRHRNFVTSDGYEILLKLRGTDLVIHYYLSRSSKASWAWRDLVTEFDDFQNHHNIVGRSFIVIIGVGEYDGNKRNQVKQVIAEVLP